MIRFLNYIFYFPFIWLDIDHIGSCIQTTVYCETHIDRKKWCCTVFLCFPNQCLSLLQFFISSRFAVSCTNLNLTGSLFFKAVFSESSHNAFEWLMGSSVESIISMEHSRAFHQSRIPVNSLIIFFMLDQYAISLLRLIAATTGRFVFPVYDVSDHCGRVFL